MSKESVREQDESNNGFPAVYLPATPRVRWDSVERFVHRLTRSRGPTRWDSRTDRN